MGLVRTLVVLIILVSMSLAPAMASGDHRSVSPTDVELPLPLVSLPQSGYTVYGPNNNASVYLMADSGTIIHTWQGSSNSKASPPYLLPGGAVIRSSVAESAVGFTGAGANGRVERIAWDGTVEWTFEYHGSKYRAHHDIEPLPNGNVLIIAWNSIADTVAIEAGRDPASMLASEIWSLEIIEVEPILPVGGNIVWRWQAWDHLVQDFDAAKANYDVVGDHPELIDVNVRKGLLEDWMHVNGIDYNAELDQIVFSSRTFNEIMIIDHSTTTAEAATHTGGDSGMGGDILYRWGNPQNYRAGDAVDQVLFSQHDPTWIEAGRPGAGNLLVLNNGQGRPGPDYSSVEEIIPPLNANGTYDLVPGNAYGPAAPVWHYEAPVPADFYSGGSSSAERQPNGNTLIVEAGEGRFFEVDVNGTIVWEHINQLPDPGHSVFKVRRHVLQDLGLSPLWAQIQLDAGLNLISLPRVLVDADPTAALWSIAGQWDILWAFSGTWTSFNPDRPAFMNDLIAVDRGAGLWVKVTGSPLLNVSGYDPISTDIALVPGWNLIGYPASVNDTVANGLAGIAWDEVIGYEMTADYRLITLGPTDIMEPGRGYWIRVTAADTLTVTF